MCERTGRWAVALRRELAATGVRVWETRTLAGCREELEQSPASFVTLEVGGDLPACCVSSCGSREIFRGAAGCGRGDKRREGREDEGKDARHRSRTDCGQQQNPLVLAVPLPSRLSPSPLSWLMREAGAVHFVDSVRQVGLLARLACRHLAQVPPPQQTLTERIWAGLPWKQKDEE